MQVLFSQELQRRFDANLNEKEPRKINKDDDDNDKINVDNDNKEKKSSSSKKEKKKRYKSISLSPGFVSSNMGHEDTRWMQTLLVLMRPLLGRDLLQGRIFT